MHATNYDSNNLFYAVFFINMYILIKNIIQKQNFFKHNFLTLRFRFIGKAQSEIWNLIISQYFHVILTDLYRNITKHKSDHNYTYNIY
jgi:hypothetical protein